jgi:hypothetical protein
MADETMSPMKELVSLDEFLSLQEELRATKASWDRQVSEKAALVMRANDIARERDELGGRLNDILVERDRLLAEKKRGEDRATMAEKLAVVSEHSLIEVEAEVARLQQAVAANSREAVPLLFALLCARAQSAVNWIRAQLPIDSPLLPYFDRLVSTAGLLGRQILRLSQSVYHWLRPLLQTLYTHGLLHLLRLFRWN